MRKRRKQKLRAKPVVGIRWRWKNHAGEVTHRGRRYFIFGVLPIWTSKERVL